MILPAKGQRTTEFYIAGAVGLGVLCVGLWQHWDAALYSGAVLLVGYALSRGIAKAGFGRAAHR